MESEEVGPIRSFFFQAEDGIRDHCVTGVQTCALPIYGLPLRPVHDRLMLPQVENVLVARGRVVEIEGDQQAGAAHVAYVRNRRQRGGEVLALTADILQDRKSVV